MKGLTLYIFKHPSFAECSNGGISETSDRVLWVGENAPKVFEGEGLPRIAIVKGNLRGTVKAVPCDDEGKPLDGHFMMGGAYIGCSDSRFSEACEAITGSRFCGLVALHDRQE